MIAIRFSKGSGFLEVVDVGEPLKGWDVVGNGKYSREDCEAAVSISWGVMHRQVTTVRGRLLRCGLHSQLNAAGLSGGIP